MSETSSFNPLRFIMNVIHMLFRAIVGAYGLNVTLHVIAIFLIGEEWVIVEFFNTFAHLLWLPTVVLVPLCLLLKEWRLVILLLSGFIAFFVVWGDMLLPKSSPQTPENTIELTVATNNLSALQVQLNDEFSAYADIEADIVALQEVDQRHVEQLTTLSPEQFPHRAIHPNGTSGQGILSAYPIIEDDYFARGFTGQSFGHQRVVLQIAESQRLVVYSVHPFHPGIGVAFFDSTMRQTEITAILDQVMQETAPIILMGDFNTSDFSQDYRMITSTYSDAFRMAGYGLGWTFPRVSSIDTTFLRLDYIFLSDQLGAQSAQVWRGDLGSDHNLLYADIFVLNE